MVDVIDWQTDGHKVELPYEVLFEDFDFDTYNELVSEGLDTDEMISNLLSDNFDWLVNSFIYEVINTGEYTELSWARSRSNIQYRTKIFKSK